MKMTFYRFQFKDMYTTWYSNSTMISRLRIEYISKASLLERIEFLEKDLDNLYEMIEDEA